MTFGAPVPFSDAVFDATGGNTKIQRKDYLRSGLLPVIDQGQEEVAGYTNDVQAAYQGALPVVLFGDHTRAFKYADAPFALGADGVKVLEPQPGFNAKFLFYYFQSCDIPSRGYSRHFKYLRETSVPYFAPKEQSRIVELLDQADALRRLRREADAKAARILPALFLKMFGDPAVNPMGWPMKPLGHADVCEINPRSRRGLSDETIVSFVPMADVDEELGRIAGKQIKPYTEVKKGFTPFEDGDVLFAKITPCMQNGKAAIAENLQGGIGYGSTEFHVLRAIHDVTAEYLYALVRLQGFRNQAMSAFTGSAGQQRVPTDFLRQFPLPVPPKQEVLKFSKILRMVMQMRVAAEQASAKLESQFNVLLQHAFSGQLTANWRQVHMAELLAEMQQQAQALNLPMPTQAHP